MTTPDYGARITWLHLTDIHVGMSTGYLWPNVEDRVLEDLERVRRLTGPWDVVFFTGDAAQRGAASEFDEFEAIRGRLLETLRALESDPVFVAVPGNHDLVRPPRFSGVVGLARDWQDEPDLREEFWTKQESDLRRGIAETLGNWTRWHRNLSESLRRDERVEFREGMLPGDFSATITIRGVRLGLVGLNTTFLQLREGDLQGQLTLDPRQLEELCGRGGAAKWANSHDAAVLLTHHPPGWLDKRGEKALRTEIAPPGRFALHLYGHQHEPHAVFSHTGGDEPRVELLGRSLFGLEKWGEQQEHQRSHGYSAGHLQFAEDGTATMRLWPRVGIEQSAGGWQIRPDHSHSLEADDGIRPVPVARPRRRPPPRTPSARAGSPPASERPTADMRVGPNSTGGGFASPARHREPATGPGVPSGRRRMPARKSGPSRWRRYLIALAGIGILVVVALTALGSDNNTDRPDVRQAGTGAEQPALDSAIRGVLNRFAAAYENEDSRAISRLFVPDAERWTNDGNRYCGRDTILETYRRNFQEAVRTYSLKPTAVQRTGSAIEVAARWIIDRPGLRRDAGGPVRFVLHEGAGSALIAAVNTRELTTSANGSPLMPPASTEHAISSEELNGLIDRYATAYEEENQDGSLSEILAAHVERRTTDGCIYVGRPVVLRSYGATFRRRAVTSFGLSNRRPSARAQGEMAAHWETKRPDGGSQGNVRFVAVREPDGRVRLAIVDARPPSG